MKTTCELFGRLDGREVELFTMENANGMAVKVATYGGTVTSILAPDRRGDLRDIVCGFNTLDGYLSEAYKRNAPYFGCVVGRYAGRIKDGVFHVQGRAYEVARNDGPNHLHGGLTGFDKRIWSAEPCDETDACVLRLSRVSPDGEEGYPGTVEVTVEYRLTQRNELRIRYLAQADQATPLSLTNHTYFNLNGFSGMILDHEARILSDRYLVPDATNVPVGAERSVAGTACDLRSPKRLGDAFAELPNGFEHYYVFGRPSPAPVIVATFSDESSGRRLEVETTEPGMLFYTGCYTADDLRREDGARFGRFRAFCCETSKYPNGPNIAGSPASVLEPGVLYDEETVFRLAW